MSISTAIAVIGAVQFVVLVKETTFQISSRRHSRELEKLAPAQDVPYHNRLGS